MSLFYERAYEKKRRNQMTPAPFVPTRWGYPISVIDPFDQAYYLSQPLAVQEALSFTPNPPAAVPMSLMTAMKLAAQGYFISAIS